MDNEIRRYIIYLIYKFKHMDLLNIFMTSALTILGGVLIYVIGEIVAKFFIVPIYEQRLIISQIIDAAVFYSNRVNAWEINEENEKIVNEFRSLSTKLRAKTYFIPLYFLCEKYGFVLFKKDVDYIAEKLIGLSNSIYRREGSEVNYFFKFKQEISERLGVDLS